MIGKKSFEIQFNWIFVLVIGAIILLFFAVIIFKQKGISEASSKNIVLQDIQAIINGASVSTDTSNIITIPSSNIEISCSKISIGKFSKQYQNLVMFAPALIKGDKLVTQTLTYSVPYRATNFLYMASPQMRYILVGDSTLAKEAKKILPSGLNVENYTTYQSSLGIKNLNNYKVRFVVFESLNLQISNVPQALEKMPDSDVTAIKINGNEEKGTTDFYQKEKNLWKLKGNAAYVGKQALIGAIYTDSGELYECNFKNALSRLKLITKVYIDRTSKLKDSSYVTNECKQIYSNALAQLNKIDASYQNSQVNINSMSEAINALAVQNKEAQRFSCALIY